MSNIKQWDNLTQDQKDEFISKEAKANIFYAVDELCISHEELVAKTIEEVLLYLYTKGHLKLNSI